MEKYNDYIPEEKFKEYLGKPIFVKPINENGWWDILDTIETNNGSHSPAIWTAYSEMFLFKDYGITVRFYDHEVK